MWGWSDSWGHHTGCLETVPSGLLSGVWRHPRARLASRPGPRSRVGVPSGMWDAETHKTEFSSRSQPTKETKDKPRKAQMAGPGCACKCTQPTRSRGGGRPVRHPWTQTHIPWARPALARSAPPGEVREGRYRLPKRGPRSARRGPYREGASAVLALPSLAGGRMGPGPAQPAGSSGKGEKKGPRPPQSERSVIAGCSEHTHRRGGEQAAPGPRRGDLGGSHHSSW